MPLICYVHFLLDNVIIEELLFCKSIAESTNDQDFLEIENELNWEKCVSTCTDGVRLPCLIGMKKCKRLLEKKH